VLRDGAWIKYIDRDDPFGPAAATRRASRAEVAKDIGEEHVRAHSTREVDELYNDAFTDLRDDETL